MPRHSLRPGIPHAKPTLSSLPTAENPFSTPAEFRESRSLFPIGRLPPAEAYLTESLPEFRARLTPPTAWRNLEAVGASRFRREPLRLGGMSGVHTTRNRSGTMTTANTQYAYAA